MLHLPVNLTAEAFLSKHWQRQPLFMPQALQHVRPAVTRNELAWLATHDDVESRIVFVDRTPEGRRYRVETGPFDVDYLRRLPKRDWTLLVHDVEKHLPALRALFHHLPFIPDWRIDDLMVSFAAPGGGVGPHRDNYDVFLCQGIGVRNWRLATNDVASDVAACDELALLHEFDGDSNYDTVEGDVLYLPPGVPHWGVAKRACITYSIGMRAPRATDIAGLLDCATPGDEIFYRDPDLKPGEARPGYLSRSAVVRALAMLRLNDNKHDQVAEALGRFITQNKDWLTPESVNREDADALLTHWDGGHCIDVHGMAQIAFDERNLYVNGNCIIRPEGSDDFLGEICGHRSLASKMSTEVGMEPMLQWMVRRGAFDLPEDCRPYVK